MSDRWLLRQNSDLRRSGIWNWTLPAFAGRLPDGRTYNTCPSAGECAPLCYARQGAYLFPMVKAAHERNLMMVLDDLPRWERRMTRELRHPRYKRPSTHVRIHDAGDFFSEEYLAAWLRIIARTPWVMFYAYTKQISLCKRVVPEPPGNFRLIYSYGGKEDDLIDPERDRHADVFPDEAAAKAAGYRTQNASDLDALYGSKRIGVPANNIRHLRKKQGDASFRALQRARDERRRGRRGPGKQRGVN